MNTWSTGPSGRVVVITGGTRGLGLALAANLGRAGAMIVIGSRDPEGVRGAVRRLKDQGTRVEGLPCDVTRLGDAQALAQLAVNAFGSLDLWINNAGLSAPYGPTLSIPPDEFTRAVATNVFGVYHGSLVALRVMLPQGSGRLVNILGRGDRRPAPLQNAYGASKAWVRMFTLALAREYRGQGVSIAAINPGLVRTDLLLRPSVIEGFEARVQPLSRVISLWGQDADAAAKRVSSVLAAEGLRNGREWHALTPPRLLLGLVREGWRAALGHPTPPTPLDVRSVAPDWRADGPEG